MVRAVRSEVESEVLQQLVQAASSYQPSQFKQHRILQGNKWLAASCLQKSIRRGLVDTAHSAAAALHRIDPEYALTRLGVIAYEDIGMANPELCGQVLLGKRNAIRKQVGEAQLMHYLVGQCAASVKDRTATDLLCLTIYDKHVDQLEHQCRTSSPVQLAEIALDESLPLAHRASASKCLAGYRKFDEGRYEVLSAPRMTYLMDVCEALGVPPVVQYLVQAGHNKTSYGVSFNLYNAANFGVPQSRERVIMLCSRDGKKLPHLMPTHSQDGSFGLPKWRTLREALVGIDPKAGDHEEFPEDRLRFYRMLGPGQYWKHLPQELYREALGGSLDSGGGKTGFLRRLDWDKPSCTLVTSPTMPATDICHPTENRPLSVQEYARIQQFPDDWIVCGSITDRYKQIGNAVPVGLGEAVGRAILAHIEGKEVEPPSGFPFSRYKNTDEVSWEAQTRSVMGFKNDKNTQKAKGQTKRKPKDNTEERQFALFAEAT